VKSAAKPQLQSIAPQVATVIGQVQRRIRVLVLLEGLAVALIWLVAMFWISLALDYLPVRFGLDELSRSTRIVLLIVTGAVVAWLIWRFILQRVFTSLKDASIALLIERKYPEFNESLLTIVERANQSSDGVVSQADNGLLKQAADKANSICQNVSLNKVLNHRHVFRMLQIAGAGILSVILFAVITPDAMKTAVSRLCFLEQQQWPRQNHIELVGLKVEFQNPVEGIEEFNAMLPSKQPNSDLPTGTRGVFYVAKGAALNL